MAIFGRSLEIICVLFSENLGNSKAIGSPRSATSVAPPPEQVKTTHLLPLGIPEIQTNFKVSMSSDGVLLQPGIGKVNDLPLMQKKVRKKIRLNYGWAFLYNSVGVFLASMGWLSPKYCAVGMVFSNLVVIYNSIFGMKLKKN